MDVKWAADKGSDESKELGRGNLHYVREYLNH